MQTRHMRSTRKPLGRLVRFAGVCLIGTGLGGCAGFWDDVTSRDFHLSSMWTRKDPMVLIQSADGGERKRGLEALKEPKQFGGSDAQQDEVLRILTEAAVNDRQPLCRFAAMRSLGRFKDPRAVQALETAYYQAIGPKPAGPFQQTASFTAAGGFPVETVSLLRCQALVAMGETNNPAAVDHLIRVLKQPATDGTDSEKQPNLDERIAAARALGHFSHYEAIDALVQVLRVEKDVALRGAAVASLQKITGKKLPDDAKQWEDALRNAPAPRDATPPAPPPSRNSSPGNEVAPPPTPVRPGTEPPPPVWPE